MAAAVHWSSFAVLIVVGGCRPSSAPDPNATHAAAGAGSSAHSTPGLGPAVQVSVDSAEAGTACALLASGRVACWGALFDPAAQRGIHASRPQLIAGITDAVEARYGVGQVCARRKTGPIVCAGDRGGITTVPGSDGALALAHVATSWCYLTASRALACKDDLRAFGGFALVPGFTELAAIGFDDYGRRCAARTDGHVVCAGAAGDTAPATAEVVPGISDAVDVAIAGDREYAAILRDGRLVPITPGNDPGRDRPAPTVRADQVADACVRRAGAVQCRDQRSVGSDYHAMSLGGDATDLACSLGTCCAVVAGAVACWGDNHGGQLGDGTPLDDLPPAKVDGLPAITAIAADDDTLARTSDGKLYAWGGKRGRPELVLDGVTAAFAGREPSAYAPDPPFAIAARGRQLVVVPESTDHPFPVLPADLRGLVITAGYRACVALADDTTRCLGEDRTAWASLDGMRDVTELSTAYLGDAVALLGVTRVGKVLVRIEDAGSAHVVAVPGISTARAIAGPLVTLADGTVMRVDLHDHAHPIAAPDPALGGLAQLGIGEDTCGLADGHVQCVGHGAKPAPLSPDVAATALAVGAHHACALDRAGAVWCWGSDADAALGRGRRVARREPGRVVDIGP